MLLTISHIEALPWITQSGPNVNPVPADSFTATLLPGGILAVTNTSGKAIGGALVTCKGFVPPELNALKYPYFGLDLEVCISPDNLARLGRLELDVKRCVVPAPNATTKIANVANCSSQLNRSTSHWEIDGNPPGWKGSGFQPVLSPTWTPLKFRYWMSATAFSFLSTTWDGCHFDVPSAMQNVPLQVTNWAQDFAIQLQTEILEPGVLTVNFRNIVAYLSDVVIA